MHLLNPVDNFLVGERLNEIWNRLDFGPRDAALGKLDRDLQLKLEVEINNALNDRIKAAFYFGWQAAKDPAEWLFESIDSRCEPSQISPADLFSEKLEALGLGNEDLFDLDSELRDAIIPLLWDAEQIAFKAGFDSQRNPEALIFEPAALARL